MNNLLMSWLKEDMEPDLRCWNQSWGYSPRLAEKILHTRASLCWYNNIVSSNIWHDVGGQIPQCRVWIVAWQISLWFCCDVDFSRRLLGFPCGVEQYYEAQLPLAAVLKVGWWSGCQRRSHLLLHSTGLREYDSRQDQWYWTINWVQLDRLQECQCYAPILSHHLG